MEEKIKAKLEELRAGFLKDLRRQSSSRANRTITVRKHP